MTPKQAKDITLEKYAHYATRAFNDRSVDVLPLTLRFKLLSCHNHCALCELYCAEEPKKNMPCDGCPLSCPQCGYVDDVSLKHNVRLLKEWHV